MTDNENVISDHPVVSLRICRIIDMPDQIASVLHQLIAEICTFVI